MLVKIIKDGLWNSYYQGGSILVDHIQGNTLLQDKVAYDATAFRQLTKGQKAAVYTGAQQDTSPMQELIDAFQAEINYLQSEIEVLQ